MVFVIQADKLIPLLPYLTDWFCVDHQRRRYLTRESVSTQIICQMISVIKYQDRNRTICKYTGDY